MIVPSAREGGNELHWRIIYCDLSVHSARSSSGKAVEQLDISCRQDLSKDNKFVVENAGKKYAKEWIKEDSDFYWNLIVDPKEYKIDIPGPIRSVTITTTQGQSTYLRISPYRAEGGISGIQITSWTGPAGKAVEDTIDYLAKGGFKEDILPANLAIKGEAIRFYPDAPWPIPPPQ